MWKRHFGRAALAALLLVACGGATVPSGKLATAKGSIRGAEEVGADQHPRAALHLKLARDQVTKAERLIENEEYEKAELMLNQAQADAEVAIGLAREARERQQAQQARARVEELRSQLQSR